MAAFGAASTTTEVLQGVNLSGRVALVTGGTSGLGFETARSLAQAGADVTITARSEAKAGKALAQLRSEVPEARFSSLVLELGNLRQVREAAAKALQQTPRIDLLINNAGIMACPLDRTPEGCELQFGTNHIGHFLWTCLLAPAVRKSDSPRVINLSSAGHKYAPVDFDDPHFEHRAYDKWQAYGQAKTANMLFSVGLTRRGIPANAVHPGAILTNLGRHMTQADLEQFGSQAHETQLEFKTVEQGAATSVWAATTAELEGRGGLYLEDCQVATVASEASPSSGYFAYGLDAEAAEALWTLSEDIVGERFTLA